MSKLIRAIATRRHRKAMAKLDPKPQVEDSVMPAPWVVELAYDSEKHDRVGAMAGMGTLLTDRHVLTCANTFLVQASPVPIGEKEFYIRYGSENLGQGTRCDIKRIHIHPDFRTAGSRFTRVTNCDLAIIELSEPACVTPVSIADGSPLSGVYAPVSVLGWPRGMAGDGTIHQVNTAIIPRVCGFTGLPSSGEIVIANLVGVGEMDDGYSGSPVLLVPGGDESKPQLVGVMSRPALGLSTAASLGIPGVATDIRAHRDWVDKTLWSDA